MNKTLKIRSGLVTPKVNVSILYKSTDGTVIKQTGVKNRILREIGVYSYVRWITGAFNNDASLWDQKQYVPKYLGVGSNQPPLTGAPGTSTAVQFSDISLFHEINDVEATGIPLERNRIKLNRASYISDSDEDGYIKVQYEAYIPEDRFVGETIGEMALMTMPTGWDAFARITFPAFKKEPNTIIQIIWEISIISVESSDRYHPLVKKYLREAIEKAIDVLQKYTEDPEGYGGAREILNHMIQPATVSGTGMYYLLNDNNMIKQDDINNYLSKPFNSLEDTGLVALIRIFDPSWGENWPPAG